jgi:hypothetical protein
MRQETNSAGAQRVPEELMGDLHDATQRFGEARRKLEHTFDDDEAPPSQRDQATAEVRAADHDLDEISRRIHDLLGRA